jgi:hypothetical protein
VCHARAPLHTRLKNAECKLSQELRAFKSNSRLLLTGVGVLMRRLAVYEQEGVHLRSLRPATLPHSHTEL